MNNTLCENKNNFLNLISILCACIVPLLVTGPFLPDLLISILSLWFLYYTFSKKYFFIYKNIYFYFFLSFCLVCILSSLLSDHILVSLKSSIFYFRIGIFALLISYLINKNKNIINYFYFSFLITFSLLIIDGYFQYFTGFNLIGLEANVDRISSFFGDELILGSYLSRLTPLFVALFIARPNKQFWEYIFIPTLILMIALLILMSGERASLLFFMIFLAFITFFLSNYKFIKICLILGFFILSFIFINNNSVYKKRIIDNTLESVGVYSSKKFIFSPQHDPLIKVGWKMFLEKPILGHGPKLFRIKCMNEKYSSSKINCHPHPHNFYIQLLAETGLVGFSFLFGLLIYFIYLVFNHILYYFKYNLTLLSNYQICLLAGLLITIWPITTNGDMFTNKLMIFYGLQIGFFRKEI